MNLRIQKHQKIVSCNQRGIPNGYVIPIYNKNDHFFPLDREPEQVNLTVISPFGTKGPHIHDIRTGFITCIKGNICIVVKINDCFYEYFSGEDYEFCSVEIPIGVAALLINFSKEDAYILNMPHPAWEPGVNEVHEVEFSDYKFKLNIE